MDGASVVWVLHISVKKCNFSDQIINYGQNIRHSCFRGTNLWFVGRFGGLCFGRRLLVLRLCGVPFGSRADVDWVVVSHVEWVLVLFFLAAWVLCWYRRVLSVAQGLPVCGVGRWMCPVGWWVACCLDSMACLLLWLWWWVVWRKWTVVFDVQPHGNMVRLVFAECHYMGILHVQLSGHRSQWMSIRWVWTMLSLLWFFHSPCIRWVWCFAESVSCVCVSVSLWLLSCPACSV